MRERIVTKHGKKIHGKFREKILAPKSKFAKKSMRWVKSGVGLVLIGCPKGKYDARKKSCKVGTRAHAVLTRVR